MSRRGKEERSTGTEIGTLTLGQLRPKAYRAERALGEFVLKIDHLLPLSLT